jgi:hypothetical protein
MRRIVALLLLSATLFACALAQESSLTSFELPASVEVTFNALLPAGSPGEPVLFAVLDDVTGLDFNAQYQEMRSSGESSVSITITVPAGTLIKYRYVRQGASGNVVEVSANGQAVGYRTYIVDGPGHLAHDVVLGWSDLAPSAETGQVSGIVTDAASGQPIANTTVVAGGIHAFTDGAGSFVVAGLPQGLHNVVVFTTSGAYLPFQQGALVAANSDTPANIQLAPTPTIPVTFWVAPPEDHTAGTPVFLAGDQAAFAAQPLMNVQDDGRYLLTVQLPVGVDIRYKYTLGDGFWNAEHLADGGFSTRQLIIPAGTTSLVIDDRVAAWAAGSSAPIWFDLTAPADGLLAYVQFNLGSWGTPLPMWPLGAGHWAYKLYSPTNFAEPLQYRYCLDAACTILEAGGAPRSVTGNLTTLQQVEDTIEAWGQ